MTTPSTGTISISDINVEVGQSSTYNASLNWINGLVKSSERPTYPNMDSYHGKAYFTRNTDGNCNNGNQNNCNCNCGIYNCSYCTNCGNINCVNCDAQNWLQTNCNCACTYNCILFGTSYDCCSPSQCVHYCTSVCSTNCYVDCGTTGLNGPINCATICYSDCFWACYWDCYSTC